MTSRTSWWWLWLAAFAVLVPVHVLFSDVLGPHVYDATAVAPIIAIGVALRRLSPSERRPLWLMLVAVFCSAAAEIVWNLWEPVTGQPTPDVSIADAGYLLFYPFFGVALALIARRRAGGRDWSSVIDALIMTIGSGVLFWQYLIVPLMADGGSSRLYQVVTVAYPVGDMVLLAFVFRLAMGGGSRPKTWWMLSTSCAMVLLGDVTYPIVDAAGGYAVGSLVDALWMVQYGLIGAAVLHPSLSEFLAPSNAPRQPLGRRRLLLLTLAALLAPTVALTVSGPGAVIPIAASVVLFLLVMGRMAGLLKMIKAAGENRFQSLVQHTTDLVLVIDGEGRCTYSSPSAERRLKGPAGELHADQLEQYVHPHDAGELTAAFLRVVEAPMGSIEELECRFGAGEYRVSSVILTNLLEDPDVAGVVITLRDVHELRQLASFDALSGLANRSRFMDTLRDRLTTGPSSVLLLDLDGFKEINDSLGHAAGDLVLVQVAHRLEAHTIAGELVARLGGDEFAIQLAQDEARARAMADAILAGLREPVEFDGLAVSVSGSIGIAHSEATSTQSDLMRAADLAMYAAKRAGKNRSVVFEQEMARRATNRMELRSSLDEALDGSQLLLFYQPIYDLATFQVHGFEALLRWHHPIRGWIMPDEFIPAAEESNQIVEIGRWVLDQAVRQLALWHRTPGMDPALTMSINVSPRQLGDQRLPADVRRVLEDCQVDPAQLILEVTEGAAIDDLETAGSTLLDLRDIGVGLAIDDYGTGNASISYLRQLPTDYLKIDRSLVEEVVSDVGDSKVLVRAIIEMASAMGLQVVAEGVETEEQLMTVRSLGCHLAQGFLLGRPSPPALVLKAFASPWPPPQGRRETEGLVLS